ncbi:amidohydrolase family protein [Nisaea sediminum]|uniref:amidohydrolase family protein n=1 Tax=Nisaea sediminum TaxID=2775867 RepID=UPI0018661E6B|nr:amidohydrolase family protein [Nisaea sediminum]
MTREEAIDCHIHIIGGAETYPFDPKRRYTQAPASVEDYWAALADTPVSRTVVVQPSFYGTDNSCMVDALRAMGGRARGVAVLDPEQIADRSLQDLHEAGVRGLRLNMLSVRSGVRPLEQSLREVDAALAGSGWHIQVFCDPSSYAFLAEQQAKLSSYLVLDHFGFLAPGAAPDERAGLLRLIEDGAWIKLSGVDRLTRGGDASWFRDLANEIADIGADRIVWGSDWPHTPLHTDEAVDAWALSPPRNPGTAGLFRAAELWFQDRAVRRRFLLENPVALYDFPN